MDTSNLDDLELELRKLPGVRAAGFSERDDMLLVQIQVAGDQPSPTLPHQAARIAYRHADKPVAIEVVRWRTVPAPAAPTDSGPVTIPSSSDSGAADASDATPESIEAEPARHRVRLLAVLTFPDTDELEVHLTFSGRRIIGRASASAGITGAVNATLEGLTNFVPEFTATIAWVEEIEDRAADGSSLVACAIDIGDDRRQGIASGVSRIEAAARATLQALNRTLEVRPDPEA